MKCRRLYPFTESSTVNGTNDWIGTLTWTVYKPNPFHGWARIVFAIDEWGHRNLPVRLHRIFLGWLCDWWDRRLGAPDA